MRRLTVLVSAVLIQTATALAQAGAIPVSIYVVSGGETAGVVPALALSVQPVSGGSPVRVSTDSHGNATTRLSPGRYRVRSLNPIRRGGEVYSWDLEFTVRALDKSVIVSLNRQNASLGIDDTALPRRTPAPPVSTPPPGTTKVDIRTDTTAFVAFKSGVIYYRNVTRCEPTRIPRSADRVYFRTASEAARLGLIPSRETGCQ